MSEKRGPYKPPTKSPSSSAAPRWQPPQCTIADLARALLSLLEFYNISRTDIAYILATGITGLETKVEQRVGPQAAAIVLDNGADFGEMFKSLLESVGVLYSATTRTLTWPGLDAPFQVKLTCGEDFSAALTRRGQPGFDAVKAIANILRALYLLQQHHKVNWQKITM